MNAERIPNPEAIFAGYHAEIESGLAGLIQDHQTGELYDSVRYVISGGGKRFRPMLLLVSAGIFGVSRRDVMSLALAVELVHNFSLVHDDIMDRAATRRGRKTVHIGWNTDIAILCGDILLAMASECISRSGAGPPDRLSQIFGRAVRELCEGQALDMEIGMREGLTTEDYLHMVDGKTGALLSASLEMGGIAGEASEDDCQALREAGRSIGRAFQILDDLLDLTADDQRWGKVCGGDLIEGKGTYLLTEVRQRAEGADAIFFARIRPGAGLRAEEIPDARARMEALGVLEEAHRLVDHYTSAALRQINLLRGNTEELHALIHHMGIRMY